MSCADELIDAGEVDESVPVLLDVDLRGAQNTDAFFVHVTVESDPDLYRSAESMRARVAEHYGVPVDRVVARPAGDLDGPVELRAARDQFAAEVRALQDDLADMEAERDRLRDLIVEYAQHNAWRCEHPDRYPQDNGCRCGLLAELAAVGIRQTAHVTVPDTVTAD